MTRTKHGWRRWLNLFLLLCFVSNSIFPLSTASAQGLTQTVLNLPVPGTKVSPSISYTPVLIKGIKIYPDDPLRFDFVIDPGDTHFKKETLQNESSKLIKYFLASLTVPEDDLWVNLSP